jgi:hypothetical protein
MKIKLQLFAAATGVFPVHNNVFKVNTKGRTALPADLVEVKDMQSFQIAVDGNVEEWGAMDQDGWVRRALTSKGLKITLSGKRQYGDVGNDYVAGLILAIGQGVESAFEWTMSSGAKLSGNCIVNLTSPAGGDSEKIDALEFEILSDGKPTYTAAA